MPSTQQTRLYANTYRKTQQGSIKYKDYQREYHINYYNNNIEYKKNHLNKINMKNYYSTDPLPSIRKLWIEPKKIRKIKILPTVI